MKPLALNYRSYRFARTRWTASRLACLVILCLSAGNPAWAADPAHGAADAHAAPATKAAASAPAPAAHASAPDKDMTAQLREAVAGSANGNRRLTVLINGKETKAALAKTLRAEAQSAPVEAHAIPAVPRRLQHASASRQEVRARAAALVGHEAPAAAGAHAGGEAHWSYEGATGPQAWGNMKPEFNVCAIGRRQSPINIEEGNTLQGPAEPLQFNYLPSSGTVVNNGHTVQVDVLGDNSLTVRGSSYKLVQFHFHHPSEERVNDRGFAMVAHLVHRNAEGQLAVVAVLLEPGEVNPLVNKVWTYMPLDAGDRVRMPAELLNMNELLPKDQRYYQFMGSLTTPPCTENVLWMVLKSPMTVSREQLKLFSQLFPNNARPSQPSYGRVVRDAQ
jgi:carbonic anhydrase